MEFEQDKRTTCAGVKRLRFSWWRNAPCHACARVVFLWFLVYEKSLLLTNDAACRGSSLTRLGPGHLMVSGDFCLSLSYLGATVSVLEQKKVAPFVAMRGGWRSFGKVRWVFYFLCTLTPSLSLTHTHKHVNIFRRLKLNFSFISRIEGNSNKKKGEKKETREEKETWRQFLVRKSCRLMMVGRNSSFLVEEQKCLLFLCFCFPIDSLFLSFFNGRVFNYQSSNKKSWKKAI